MLLFLPARPCFWRSAVFIGVPFAVGIERLRLEGEKHTAPLSVWFRNDYATILINAVILPVLAVITLVHVDIMNAVARLKIEILARREK